MYHRSVLALLVVATVCVTATEDADAFPWRRRSNNNYYNYSYNYNGTGGIQQIAPRVDGESAEYPEVAAYYSYDLAMDEDVSFADRIRIYLSVYEESVQKAEQPLVAEVRLTDLSNSDVTHVRHVPVKLTPQPGLGYTLAELEVGGSQEGEGLVQPGRVYRCFVNLHRKGEQYGSETAIGRIPAPYYVATSGPTLIEQARHHIVMRTFKEYYYTKQGWSSGENYVMDCHDYYLWATGSCTVGSSNGRTILGRLFGGRTPYCDSSQIAQLANQGPIHADYVRIPGHTFMLLAYDSQYNRVWTMEGNFNSTIEVAVRSVSPGWTVGHLSGEHIRADLFRDQQMPASMDDPEEMDDMEAVR